MYESSRLLESQQLAIEQLPWRLQGYSQCANLNRSCADISAGSFQWGGHDFAAKAKNIRFNPEEGGSHVPVLRAELRDDAGDYHERDVNLAERINNRNGNLQFSW
jgi:hypothetical protein